MAVGEALFEPGRNYASPAPLPDGQYKIKLTGVQNDWHLSAAGNETRKVKFLVVSTLDGQDVSRGHLLFPSLTISSKAFLTWMFLQACGVTERLSNIEEAKANIDETIAAYTGKEFIVTLGTKPADGNYSEENIIRRFETHLFGRNGNGKAA